ncbi:MAG: hypothetical protein ABSC42_16135 [Tepidisphaeraceae bacterium]
MNTRHVHHRWQSLCRGKSILARAAVVAVWLFCLSAARHSNAANIVLTDGNSAVTINPTGPAGVENWSINGQNQLSQEWFWIRTGSTGGQSNIETLGAPSVTLYDTTGDGQNDTAMLTYGSSHGLQITVTYGLTGGQAGSKTSDLADVIEIANDGTSPQAFHFFEYANFNLGDLASGQAVTISQGSGSDTATDVGNGWQVQTVVSPASSEFEANDYPSLFDSISSSTTACTLSDASTSTVGDGEWGFEWDMTLKAGGSCVISGDQNVVQHSITPVPEPASNPIAVLGLSGLCLTRPRRQARCADG